MIISEILIISHRGVILISKKYRQNVPEDARNLIVRSLQLEKGSGIMPVRKENGLFFYCIKRHTVYFVAISANEVPQFLAIEFLCRLYSLIKDFCGIVTEEAIIANGVLIQEQLDFIMDSGYIQVTDMKMLSSYIISKPAIINKQSGINKIIASGLFGAEHRDLPSCASEKSIVQSRLDMEHQKNEIFLDVIERMTAIILSGGTVIHAELAGNIQMKSFLINSPSVKLGLNEDLTVGTDESKKPYGVSVHLNDCHFHECVNLDNFDSKRELILHPPKGDFTVMSYRINGLSYFSLPFKLLTAIEETENSVDLDIILKLSCDIPNSVHALNIQVKVPVPQTTSNISQQLNGENQSAEFSQSKKHITWSIRKLFGGCQTFARFKLIEGKIKNAEIGEMGPITLKFELSNHICSGLNIKYLHIMDSSNTYVPFRWIRYATIPDSYVFKF